MQELKQTIYATLRTIIEDLELGVSEIHDEDTFVEDLGLKSLDLARMVAMLELKLGVDPFAELVSITSIRTVGDLHAAYAQCFTSPAGGTDSSSGQPAAPAAKTDSRANQQDLNKGLRRGI